MGDKFNIPILTIFIALSLLAASQCTNSKEPPAPIKSMNVSATLENSILHSGSSTILVVNARNNGTSPVTGSFVINPENNQVTVLPRPENFTRIEGESTGDIKYNLTAYANSVRQDIQITVMFTDATTNAVLGQKIVTLSVYK